MKVRYQNIYLADLGREEVYVLADDASSAAQKAQEYADNTTERAIDDKGDLIAKNIRDLRAVRMMSTKVIY